jgi:cytochrome c oxidase subunit 2
LELASKLARYFGVAIVLLLLVLLFRAWILSERTRAKFQVIHAISKAAVVLAVGATSALLFGLLWVGYVTYLDANVAPADAYDIQVLSEQGILAFSYPNGRVSKDRLVLPKGKAVRLVLSSKDTTRGIAIPQLKLREAANSGRYTSVWFQVPEARPLSMQCTEGCSKKNLSEPTVQILGEAQFESWLASKEPIAPNDSTRQGQHAGSR